MIESVNTASHPPERGLALLTPTIVRQQVRQLAGTSDPPGWAMDLRLLGFWLLVWVLNLCAAALSPVVVLLQLIAREKHWRLAVLFFVVLPVSVLFVLALSVRPFAGIR